MKVSVIIPTFNRAHFLEEAIDSVLSQTYKDFELIIVDDGSTDNTKDIISKFKKKIIYLYQEHRGVSLARNNGINLSEGVYVAFLDSDDCWKKEKLETQVRFFESNPQTLICYTDEIWIRNGVRVNPKKKHAKHSGMIFEKCLPLCIISPSSVIIKKDVLDDIGTFNESFKVCEDYDLWLRVSHKYRIHFIDKKLIIKRGGHDDQLSRSSWGFDIYRVSSMENLLSTKKLSRENSIVLLFELVKKCTILFKGFSKRKKKESEIFKKKIDAYMIQLEKS